MAQNSENYFYFYFCWNRSCRIVCIAYWYSIYRLMTLSLLIKWSLSATIRPIMWHEQFNTLKKDIIFYAYSILLYKLMALFYIWAPAPEELSSCPCVCSVMSFMVCYLILTQRGQVGPEVGWKNNYYWTSTSIAQSFSAIHILAQQGSVCLVVCF